MSFIKTMNYTGLFQDTSVRGNIVVMDNDQCQGDIQRLSFLRNVKIKTECCLKKPSNLVGRIKNSEAKTDDFLPIMEQGCARPGMAEFLFELMLMRKNKQIDHLFIITTAGGPMQITRLYHGYGNFLNLLWTDFFKRKYPDHEYLLRNGLVYDNVYEGIRNKHLNTIFPNATKTAIVDDTIMWTYEHFKLGMCVEQEVSAYKAYANLICEVPEYYYDFPINCIPEKYKEYFEVDYKKFPYKPEKNTKDDNVLLFDVLPKIKAFYQKEESDSDIKILE